MTVENSRQTKSLLTSMNTSVGRFYEKRHQLDGALNEYSRAIINNDDISSYIGRARVHLKMGSIHSHQDTGNQQKKNHIDFILFFEISRCSIKINRRNATKFDASLL
jgi:hypothetical protein